MILRRLMTASSTTATKATTTPQSTLRIQIIDPLKTHRHTVIFMHGLGDTSLGFASMFAGPFLSDALAHTRFVLPNAPIRPVSVNQGARMPAWYDIRSLSNRGLASEDRAGMLESAAQIRQIIADESDRIGSENVTVAGFSQGGAMAVLSALTFDRPLARIFAASAYVVMRDTYPDALAPQNAATAIMAVHGEDDNVVPLEYSRSTFDDLSTRANVPVTYLTFEDMGHEFPPHIEQEFAEFCEPSEKEPSSFNSAKKPAVADGSSGVESPTARSPSPPPKL